MASLNTKFFGFTDQYVNDIAVYTMSTYYRSEEKDASPINGFCIPIEPETRLTNSPTGGVIGRYMAKSADCGSPSRTTSNTTGSAHSSPAVFPEIKHSAGPALQQQLPLQTPYSRSDNVNLASASAAHDCYSANPDSNYAGTRKMPASASASTRATSNQKHLSAEDMEFLMKTLDEQVKASSSVSLMTLLVPVHRDRPGKYILRMDERTGGLYACIPGNPFAPEDNGKKQDYNLPTYDSYIQKTARGGRRAQDPYPAVGPSSLNTCNHCGIPTKVLNNDSLCPFHAYYIATGRFLGYYEFCALAEMEKQGLSIASGWWTIEEMVQFVGALTKRIEMWIFLEESSAIPDGSWKGKVSPYGAIGEPVPSRAQGKTAYRVGTEQKMSQAVSSHATPVTMEKIDFQTQAEQTLAMVMGRQTELTTLGITADQASALDQIYNGAAGAICV